MTVNNIQELKQAIEDGKVFRRYFAKNAILMDTGGSINTAWLTVGSPKAGAAPATKEAPTRATTGALHFPTPATNSFLMRQHQNTGNTQCLMIVDVLSWSAGLSGTVTGEQTTNLPTTALSRYTNGENVWLGLICWTATGSTSVNVTARYTNQAGTGSRNTASVTFWSGGLGAVSGAPSAGQVQFLPLQSGDYGVRSVEGVTLSASTLGAGNFGVILCKMLSCVQATMLSQAQETDNIVQTTFMPEIVDDACLVVFVGLGTGSTNVVNGHIDILQV